MVREGVSFGVDGPDRRGVDGWDSAASTLSSDSVRVLVSIRFAMPAGGFRGLVEGPAIDDQTESTAEAVCFSVGFGADTPFWILIGDAGCDWAEVRGIMLPERLFWRWRPAGLLGEAFGGEVNASKTDGTAEVDALAEGDVRFPFDFAFSGEGKPEPNRFFGDSTSTYGMALGGVRIVDFGGDATRFRARKSQEPKSVTQSSRHT